MTTSPERQMKVTMVLADHAQIADGKMFIAGGGWTEMAGPVPFAVALMIDVPWHATNAQHQFTMELIDQDGQNVTVPTPNGEEPLKLDGQFEVGRPPGARPGSSFPTMYVLKIGGLPIAPGAHYEWRLMIDGETQEDWRLLFSTRPEAQAQTG
jgi:hypothetical protein